jgi:tetratricopeptide (TPR) repeat protein
MADSTRRMQSLGDRLVTSAFLSRWKQTSSALAMVCFLLAAPLSFAQVLDDIEVVPQADGVAVVVHFAAQIQYRRHLEVPERNELQVFFAITANDPSIKGIVEDVRYVPASLGLPAITVRYSAGLQSASFRRIDLDFAARVEVLQVSLGPDNRSLIAILRAPDTAAEQIREPATFPKNAGQAVPSPVEVTPDAKNAPAMATPPADEDAEAKLTLARTEMTAGRYEQAIALLNQILNLPPNKASMDAQELIGTAREGLGEVERARVEYELFLKLYPDSPGTSRVTERLAAIGEKGSPGAKSGRPAQWLYWGSIGQSYYGGQSRIRNETTIVTPGTDGTVIDVQDISSNDQSSVVTNLDANARYRGNGWDNRFVFRNVSVVSFLNGQPSQNRLSALYADFKNEEMRLDARVGRQSSTSGAVLGRFDGATMHYGVGPSWRIGAFAGTPAESTLGGRKHFYGATLDNDKLLDGLGFGLYAVEQRSEGFVDRRSVGNEIRYFTPKFSLFSLLDYDIHFNRINIASTQGTFSLSGGTNFNFLYDYRRSPPLQLTNALLGRPTSSLQELIDAYSPEQIEREALGLTPVSKVLLLGAQHPVTRHWQLGAEFRLSSVSGTIATDTLPASAGTGNVYSYTLQAIGTGIFTPSSVLVFNGVRLTSRAYDAWLASVNTRFRPTERWAIEPTLRYYIQDNKSRDPANTGSSFKRLSPSVRMTYQLREKISIESEVSLERSRSNSTLVNENSNLIFYYLGYRVDL